MLPVKMKEDRVDQIQPRVDTAGTSSWFECLEVERKIEKNPKSQLEIELSLLRKGSPRSLNHYCRSPYSCPPTCPSLPFQASPVPCAASGWARV